MFRLDVARSRAFAFCLTIFCLWLGGSTAVLAQAADAPPADPAAEEEPADSFFAETTVTATGSAIDTFLTPQPVTVIDPLDRPADNAADLLRIEPGVDVNGVGPNQSRPVIRGQRGLRILFLENGLRMNNARRQTDFGEIPALVSLGDVDQVEVVRGPASVLYGSDAIGGVLNLVTKRPVLDRPLAGTADVRYSGAGDRAQGRLGIAGTADRWSYSLAYTRRDADDYSAPDGTYGEIELADSVEVLDTGIEDSWVDAYLGFLSNDRHEFFARYSQYRADDAGFGLVDPELLGDAEDFRIRILYPFQDFDKITLGWRGSGLETPVADTVDWQVYWQRNERELVNDIDIDIGPLFFGAPNSTVESDTRNLTDLETFGSRLEVVKVAHADHVLTWGAEFWQDDSFNTDFSRTVTTLRFPFPPFEVPSVATDSVPNAPNAENRSTGVFLQDEWSVSDRFKVIGGARFQTVETVAE
ncbi:MAG: TonB-dependent receptor, partial [Acidobacteriota bacterium]